jgi:DNA-binding NarL/FixJ family response regulator
VAVLLLSHYLEPSYAIGLVESHPGSVGYLIKERVFDAAILVDALRRVCDGQTVIDPTIVAQLLARQRRHNPLDRLTPREREVLSLVAEGMSNRAIANQIFVTDRTVEAHIKRIFDKLGLVEDPDQHRGVRAVVAFLQA